MHIKNCIVLSRLRYNEYVGLILKIVLVHTDFFKIHWSKSSLYYIHVNVRACSGKLVGNGFKYLQNFVGMVESGTLYRWYQLKAVSYLSLHIPKPEIIPTIATMMRRLGRGAPLALPRARGAVPRIAIHMLQWTLHTTRTTVWQCLWLFGLLRWTKLLQLRYFDLVIECGMSVERSRFFRYSHNYDF